jgi:hypothetical protein
VSFKLKEQSWCTIKIDVLSMQAFLEEKFELWAGNGYSVEGIWNRYKGIIFEATKRYIPKNL